MTGIVIIGAEERGVPAGLARRAHGFDNSVTLIGAETALPYAPAAFEGAASGPRANPAGDNPDRCITATPATHPAAAAGIGPGTAIAKDLRNPETLIEREAAVDPDVRADPSQTLKRPLKAA